MSNDPTTQQATIHPGVQYTPGDGAAITIRPGKAEVQRSADSATLSWTHDDGSVGSAAMPRTQFERYVQSGKITFGEAV